jgi:hypothetical protein
MNKPGPFTGVLGAQLVVTVLPTWTTTDQPQREKRASEPDQCQHQHQQLCYS